MAKKKRKKKPAPPKKKFPLRAVQFARFLDREYDFDKVRKELRVSPERLDNIIDEIGKKPTKRQQQILRNIAIRVASDKSRRMGFTSEQIKKSKGKPMLMLARARAMNRGYRKANKVSWQEASVQLGLSFDGLSRIKRKKDRDKAYEALRKVVSPTKYSKLEVKSAKSLLRKVKK